MNERSFIVKSGAVPRSTRCQP